MVDEGGCGCFGGNGLFFAFWRKTNDDDDGEKKKRNRRPKPLKTKQKSK
jgi:hypothetical protein